MDIKELKNYLKGHHFDFGIKGSRTTQNKNQPYLRSDLSGQKSGLAFERSNQEFKRDQQKAHFNFGFDPRPTSASNLGLIKSQKAYGNTAGNSVPKQVQTIENGQISNQVLQFGARKS